MLAWRITRSEKVNALSGPWPMLLYTWLIPHCDNLGRMEGEPAFVKVAVFARRTDVAPTMVAEWLTELSDKLLILWYTVDGMKYIQFPEQVWNREQKLTGNMRRTSDLPPCPNDVYTQYVQRTNDVRTPSHGSLQRGREGEVEVEGEVEGKEEGEGKGEGEARRGGTVPVPDIGQPNVQVNDVRTRTEPNRILHQDPGPAFWNDPVTQNRIFRLVELGNSREDARRLILIEFHADRRAKNIAG